ncbi:MAG: ABC transporter permease [Nanoarchaeota archaeon]|nr:ABC transporter permease [Nanoarchaeota archaeon]
MLKYLKFTFGTFQQRKLRSILTMIGIFIGIAMIVTLISLGQGLKGTIQDQFEAMGVDKIMIFPGGSGSFFGVGQVGGPKLLDKDLDTIRKTPGIKLVSGMSYKIAKISFKDETKYTWLIGLPTDESKTILQSYSNFNVVDGRNLEEGDKYVAIVGYYLYEENFYEKPVEIRDKIIIEGTEFKVVGHMGKIGSPQDDSQVYIPIDTYLDLMGGKRDYGFVIAQVSDASRVDEIAERVRKELRKERDVEKGEEDFTVQTTQQAINSFSKILNIVQAVLIGLATISLVVGGVGIMNTMYTSVMERTREIGIMKAIGAKNSSIITIFLIEAGVLGLVGGAIGTTLGVIAGKFVEFIAASAGYSILKIKFSASLIIFSILFSFTVGAISGILPAIRAARLKPVEALRYE